MNKGIILSPDIEARGRNGILMKSNLPQPSMIRHFLMYWDKLAFVTNNAIYTEPSNDMNFLASENIMEIYNYRPKGMVSINSDFYLKANIDALNSLSLNSGEEWSLGQNIDTPFMGYNNSSLEKNVLEVEFYNLLPVPSDEVSFDDILKFKENRKAELLVLREYLDDLQSKTLNAENIETEKDKNISKITSSIADIHALMSEVNMSTMSRTLRAVMSTPEAHIANKIAEYIPHQNQQLAVKAFGYSAGAIRLYMTKTKIDKSFPDGLRNLSYLSYMSKEL